MHYMHYKDYIHHGLAAEKTPPPLPQGGGTIWLGGGGCGGPCSYIYMLLSPLIPTLSGLHACRASIDMNMLKTFASR